MIGVGVFTTSGFALQDLGSPGLVVLAWVLGALHAAIGAWCYGQLAALHPRSGGEFVLLTETVHPAAGFVAGWVSLLAGFAGPIAAAAHTLEAYLQRPGVLWIGALTIVLATLLHGVQRRWGTTVQTGAVALKLGLLVVFAICGAWALAQGSAAPSEAALNVASAAATGPTAGTLVAANPWALGPTLVWVSFSYAGWNMAVYVVEEVDPQVRGSLAWLGVAAVAVVGGFYVVLNALFVYSAPLGQLAGRPDVGLVAAEALGGQTLSRPLALIVALALFTSISSLSMAGPRVIWQMARQGALPRFLGQDPGVPRRAILAQGLLSLAVYAVASLADLLGYIGLTLSLSSALTVLGLLLEWRRAGPTRRPGLLGQALPVLFALATLAMLAWLAWLKPLQALASLGTIGLGLVFWGVSGRPGRRAEAEAIGA